MPDLNALKADPDFAALQKADPARAQKLLSHLEAGGGASTWQRIAGVGKRVEGGYESLAQPVTRGVAKGLGAIEPQGLQDAISPQTQAEMIVPQSVTQAGLTAASMALPEAGIAEKLGEAAGPITRALGTRVGRIAGMTGAGAVGGAISGEGALSGAGQGLAASVPGEAGSRAFEAVGSRWPGAGSLIGKTTAALGNKIRQHVPWLQGIDTPAGLEDAFARKGAVNEAGTRLEQTLNNIASHPGVKGQLFNVPTLTPNGVSRIGVPFHDAIAAGRELREYAFAPTGQARASVTSRAAQDLSHEVNDQIEKTLRGIDPALADQFLESNKHYAVAKTFSHIFEKPGVLAGGQMNQPAMIKMMLAPRNRDELQRTLGKPAVDELFDVLRRGYKGTKTDTLAQPGSTYLHMGLGFLPVPSHHFGSPYQAVGEVPGYMRPSGKFADAAAAGIERGMGLTPTPEHGTPWVSNPSPYSKEKDRLTAEQFVGTKNPERINTVAKLQDKVRKEKQPRVEHELRTGRLSMPALKRMLSGMTEQNMQATLGRLSPVDAAHIYTLADPGTKIWLAPVVESKLQSLVDEGHITPTQLQELTGEA